MNKVKKKKKTSAKLLKCFTGDGNFRRRQSPRMRQEEGTAHLGEEKMKTICKKKQGRNKEKRN
jgi:hypothetical protein